MDDLVKALESFISTANSMTTIDKIVPTKWKECVALIEDKWKVVTYSEIENSTDIIIKWAKRDKALETRMSLSNQIKWLEYLETHKKEKVHVK